MIDIQHHQDTEEGNSFCAVFGRQDCKSPEIIAIRRHVSSFSDFNMNLNTLFIEAILSRNKNAGIC